MAQTYTFRPAAGVDTSALLEKARVAGRARGVRFVGDDREGRFDGVAKGSYLVREDEVLITVEKKPSLVPWGMIESALQGLFQA